MEQPAPLSTVTYRVASASGDDEAWFEDTAAADAAVARLLNLELETVGRLRRPITVDPIVVRRDGARWRSRRVWSIRSGSTAVRVFEMLRVDETLYDH